MSTPNDKQSPKPRPVTPQIAPLPGCSPLGKKGIPPRPEQGPRPRTDADRALDSILLPINLDQVAKVLHANDGALLKALAALGRAKTPDEVKAAASNAINNLRWFEVGGRIVEPK